jgi:hypothetical protein
VRALDASGANCDALLEAFGMSRKLLSNPYEILPLTRYVTAFERAAEEVLARARVVAEHHDL